jgi:sugar phosphate isomerase/epimerase
MPTSIKLGAITNSWRNQLGESDLSELIKLVSDEGAQHIELRQTCLGTYESGEGLDWELNMDGIAKIVASFPNLKFNLAVASTCLTTKIDPKGKFFQGALAGAKLVGKDNPHLRTVDPSADVADWSTPEEISPDSMQLVDLVKEAASQGVVISIENSGLTISAMHVLVNAVRAQLKPEEKIYIGICPDPTNQLRRHPDSDPLKDLNDLELDMIKLVHYKQAQSGTALPIVTDGDIDCDEMVNILDAKGYGGMGILEIPSDDNVIDNFKISMNYLKNIPSRN